MTDKFTTLLEVDGWSFMREPEVPLLDDRDYIFIAHTTCPKGVELEIVLGDRFQPPSVMHYEYHTCQRCNASPPDGLFAAYALYEWGTGAHS